MALASPSFVELDVDVAARNGPFCDAAGPPFQVRLAVGAGVEVAVVRAAQADVGDRHSQHAGQPRLLIHAVDSAAGLQQG